MIAPFSKYSESGLDVGARRPVRFHKNKFDIKRVKKG
jgi:hypothetical protein